MLLGSKNVMLIDLVILESAISPKAAAERCDLKVEMFRKPSPGEVSHGAQ